MKVFKPQRLSVLHRVFEHHRQRHLVVSVFAWIPLDDPKALGSEPALWKAIAEETPQGLLDPGAPKPRAEVLVTGRAFASNEPVGAVMTRVQAGPIDKQLAVIGDRHWVNGEPSAPTPFTEMPLDWSRAFGGPGFERNPLGKGAVAIETEKGPLHPLPNVENPKQLVASRSDRPEPAGYGAYDVMWPQRFRYVGTYDAAWQRTLFPGPAADFDAHYYMDAPPDQWADGFFHGDESFVLEGMHPTRSKLEGRLAPFTVKAFLTQRRDDGTEQYFALETRLDTLHFFPHRGHVAAVFRATHEIRSDDADDVVDLMVAAEDPTRPRTASHYRDVRAHRYDKDLGALASLVDADLMPPAELGWTVRHDLDGIDELMDLDSPALEKAMEMRKRKLEQGRKRLDEKGMDTSAFDELDAIESPPNPFDIEATTKFLQEKLAERDQIKKDLEAQREASLAKAREAFRAMGLDYDQEEKKARQDAARPPRFSAAEHLAQLHELSRIAHMGGEALPELDTDLTDPRFEEELLELERRVREGYRQSAHIATESPELDETEAAMLRARAQAAKDGGESLAAVDLTAANLSGLDLSNMNMRGAMLAHVDLTGAKLHGCDLTQAVLAGANLTGADFTGANLSEANFGATTCRGTSFAEANLSGTIFSQARLDAATFMGANLETTQFIETQFGKTDLSHVRATRLVLFQCDLRGLAMTGATARDSVFYEVDLSGVDFTGSDFSRCQFLKCAGAETSFAGATLEHATFTYGSSFPRSCFDAAKMSSACMRTTDLSGGSFLGAELTKADLSACKLTGGKLDGIRARGSMWIRADLEGASLTKADLLESLMSKAKLRGTNLAGANLARADISLVELDGRTNVDGALMLDTRVDPKHEEQRGG